MRTIVHSAGEETALSLVLLSGTYSEPEDFVRQGFSEAVSERAIDAEVVMAEVRAAWFADGSIVRRLHESVVLPARARGRSRIWLAGISLGGLAALCYAARHESAVAGIVLISPYPATRDVLREIAQPGGPGDGSRDPAEGDLEREAWLWLASPSGARPPVHCYFASDDRFAPGQRRMAATLAPECVRELPGGHDWSAWRALWLEFLDRDRAALQ
jgi:S-formylglutathione hydrolase FrmB